MEQLVDKGLCKAIGISNFTIKKTQTLLETARIVPACNQGMLVFDIFLICLFFKIKLHLFSHLYDGGLAGQFLFKEEFIPNNRYNFLNSRQMKSLFLISVILSLNCYLQ